MHEGGTELELSPGRRAFSPACVDASLTDSAYRCPLLFRRLPGRRLRGASEVLVCHLLFKGKNVHPSKVHRLSVRDVGQCLGECIQAANIYG